MDWLVSVFKAPLTDSCWQNLHSIKLPACYPRVTRESCFHAARGSMGFAYNGSASGSSSLFSYVFFFFHVDIYPSYIKLVWKSILFILKNDQSSPWQGESWSFVWRTTGRLVLRVTITIITHFVFITVCNWVARTFDWHCGHVNMWLHGVCWNRLAINQ